MFRQSCVLSLTWSGLVATLIYRCHGTVTNLCNFQPPPPPPSSPTLGEVCCSRLRLVFWKLPSPLTILQAPLGWMRTLWVIFLADDLSNRVFGDISGKQERRFSGVNARRSDFVLIFDTGVFAGWCSDVAFFFTRDHNASACWYRVSQRTVSSSFLRKTGCCFIAIWVLCCSYVFQEFLRPFWSIQPYHECVDDVRVTTLDAEGTLLRVSSSKSYMEPIAARTFRHVTVCCKRNLRK